MNFNVKNIRTQSRFPVENKQYILSAAIQAGLMLPHSCRVGNCGSCKALLVKGRVTQDEFESTALNKRQKADGQILLCRSQALTDIEIDIEEFSHTLSTARTWQARIKQLKKLNHDVMQLTLKLAPGTQFEYLAGQYIDFLLPDNVQRSYSIAGMEQGNLEFHIRKVTDGKFTEQVFHRYQDGDIVRIYGPLGTFFLREQNTLPILMLAGGSGFAPLKHMLESICASGKTQPVKLYWGVRTLEDLYLKFWLEQFAQQNNWFDYTIVLSKADQYYSARQGLVHQAVLDDFADLNDYQVYASGPPQMIQAALSSFTDRGLDQQHFYFDSFDYAADTLAKINASKL